MARKRNRHLQFLLLSWIMLSAAAEQEVAFAQPSNPTLDVRVDSTNVIFDLSGQSGLFYTWQTSSDLTNWISYEPVYADSTALSLTQSVSELNATEFLRVKVNHPNTAVATNYA